MKVDLNTTKGFLDFELPAIGELTEKIGAQLGAVDAVIDIGSKYQGIVIVKVVSCQKHPDADKLSLCLIDDSGVVKDVARNQNGLVEVVCGAPNVQQGQTVAWIPPSMTVPDSVGKESFIIEAREIRGKVSNGMLASAKELALGDNHDGILVFDGDYKPGTDFAEATGLKDDFVIDIENKMFTHRPDCFGFLGVARELAGIYNKPFKSPDWYVTSPEFPDSEADELTLEVKNELPQLVPRFTAAVLSNVQVGDSPLWLQIELAKVGQKSINNIVDYTNFYMHETGQPLHAYDYDKVKALSQDEATIVIRNPKPGEKIKLLNGKEIEPRAEAVMIATDKKAIGIGGVMGGSETEVDENTTNIILECANFDMYSIRRTSMAHGLFTDAVTRFTKGQSPLQNLAVLFKIVNEIRRHDSGKMAGPVIDDNRVNRDALERRSVHPPVKLGRDFINSRLGLSLSTEEIKKLLENVEFQVEVNGDSLTVTVPFWRTDIELREDIVEEVGRLYGYDHLPLDLPQRDLTPAPKDELLSLKARIRDRLSRAGANEVLTYSFVHGDLLRKVGQDPAKAFQVSNALSPELQYYRISLMPSLLEKVHPNIKAGYDRFALFETGKTHSLDQIDENGLPREFEYTGLVVTANDKLKPAGAAYYQAKRYLEYLAGNDQLVYKPVSDNMQQYPVVQPYDLNRTALVSLSDGTFLGIIGEFKASVRATLKLPRFTAGFEVDTTVLQTVVSAGPVYRPLSLFPSVKQDITLTVPSDMPYQELAGKFTGSLQSKASKDCTVQVEPVGIYQPDKSENKNVTFHVRITSYDRTLTDQAISELLAAAAKDVGVQQV